MWGLNGRGRAPGREAEFEGMFQFKAGLFLQEMLSIFTAPFILW